MNSKVREVSFVGTTVFDQMHGIDVSNFEDFKEFWQAVVNGQTKLHVLITAPIKGVRYQFTENKTTVLESFVYRFFNHLALNKLLHEAMIDDCMGWFLRQNRTNRLTFIRRVLELDEHWKVFVWKLNHSEGSILRQMNYENWNEATDIFRHSAGVNSYFAKQSDDGTTLCVKTKVDSFWLIGKRNASLGLDGQITYGEPYIRLNIAIEY